MITRRHRFLRPNRYDHFDRRVQKITPAATSNSSTPNSSTRQLYIPFYDAYGNVMGYWDAQGNVVAEYTYDAFGKLISSSGPMADVFAIRYSTKYFDIETGLYYYGYRFYSPELMRWITRDPIGEEGGENLYAMCENDSISFFDALGMWRMISGAYLVREKDAKRVEYKAAMKIMILLDKLNTYRGKDGHRLYDAQLKDMVRTPVSTIKDEIDKNPDNVYLIAHGGLSVNGNVWKKRYYVWNSTDSVVEWLDISHDGKPVTPLSQFGNKLKIQNVYACYLSPGDRKIAVPGVGDVVSRKSNLDQRMTDLLKALTEKYTKNGKQKCTIKVSVYEGERNRVSGGQFYGTREAKRFWKERSPYNKEGARKWWEE